MSDTGKTEPMAGNAAISEDPDFERELALLELRIVHALEIFPFLSRSGIHQQIGTSTPTGLWQPVLQRLLNSGRVVCTEVTATTPLERVQKYSVYHLPTNQYTPANDSIRAKPAEPETLHIAS